MGSSESIDFVRYRTIASMPLTVQRKVKTMGYVDDVYHLRHVAHGRNGYSLRSAIILFKNNIPIGWVVMYMDGPYRHCSIWINYKYRKRGYGTILMRKAYRNWRRYNPETHGYQFNKWNEWDAERIHK